MIHRLLPLLLLATPAPAQDADPTGQMIEGYVACYMARGDAEVITTNLGLYGWTHEPPSDGIIVTMPTASSDTFALLAEDASFCHIESMTQGTAKAAEMLALAVVGALSALPAPGTTEAGCPLYDLGDSITATITSGGTEPTCTSDTTSTLRLDFVLE